MADLARALCPPIISSDALDFDVSAGLPVTLATTTGAAAAAATGGSCLTAPIPRAPSALSREDTTEDPGWFPRPPTPPLPLGADGIGAADGDLVLLPTSTSSSAPGRELVWALELPTAAGGSGSSSVSDGGGGVGHGGRANEACFDRFEEVCRSGSATAASSAAAVVAAAAAAAAATRETGLPPPLANCVPKPLGGSPREPLPPPPPPPLLPPPLPAVLAPWVATPTVPPLPTPSRLFTLSPFMHPPPRSPMSSSVATSSSPPSQVQPTSSPPLPAPPPPPLPPPPPHRPVLSLVSADARPPRVSSAAVDDQESSGEGNSSNGSNVWGFRGGGSGSRSGGFPSTVERYCDPSVALAAVAAAATVVGESADKSVEMERAGEPLSMVPTGGVPPSEVLPPATDDDMGSSRTPPALSVAAQLAAVEAEANACRIALVTRLKAEQAARSGGDHLRRRRRRTPYNGTNGDGDDDDGDRGTGDAGSSRGVGSGGNGGGPTAGEVRKRRAATRCENNRISARGARVWAARYREGLEGCLAAAAVAAADRERTVERLRAEVAALRQRLRG